MRIVLDTNLLLTAISQKSARHWIFRELIDGNYTLCVSTEILMEYVEIIERHMNIETADLVMNALLQLPNVALINPTFRWNLIKDEDDNKFVDCALAANANYLVSEDKHFNVLKTIPFPKLTVLSAEKFKVLLYQYLDNQ